MHSYWRRDRIESSIKLNFIFGLSWENQPRNKSHNYIVWRAFWFSERPINHATKLSYTYFTPILSKGTFYKARQQSLSEFVIKLVNPVCVLTAISHTKCSFFSPPFVCTQLFIVLGNLLVSVNLRYENKLFGFSVLLSGFQVYMRCYFAFHRHGVKRF